MNQFISDIFDIVLLPFNSETFLVVIPCIAAFVCGLFALVRRLITHHF